MKSVPDDSSQQWQRYYDKTVSRPPREFLRTTLRYFQTAGDAIDLGCGTGTETLFLLRQGWQVLAIDQQAPAIDKLTANTPTPLTNRLHTQVATFETIELPPSHLIWAGYSLPFCHPDQFTVLWDKICNSLHSGGRFVGDFFGTRHVWTDNPKITFHTKEQVLKLCEPLHLEYMQEGEGEQMTALGGMRHWHMFTIRARKP